MKNHELRARVSKEEFDKIKKKCDKAGIPLSTFLRYIAINSTIEVKIGTEHYKD